jgi:hypothetical protein
VGGRIAVGVIIVIIFGEGEHFLLFIIAFPPHLIARSRDALPRGTERKRREQAIFILGTDGEASTVWRCLLELAGLCCRC